LAIFYPFLRARGVMPGEQSARLSKNIL